ncbi:multicopper oxidase domain-containing protein [Glacieibacterium frigidum]|uniref:multicopper oxidase domain-containing protein n=1 Tax=Glacieibacterium frigidum TaxID=2593303 RepID=UPI001A9C6ACD|nr:multicopper oxidase domain-containing protein [Glacieibacterium frigidum]
MRLTAFLLVLATAASVQARTYDLTIERQVREIEPGRKASVITLNGSVPGPVLRFTEGETGEVRITNRLKEKTSIHWHGLLIPGENDGSPGFNGFTGIEPGATFTATLPLRQSGTYWYHAHSATQEQAGQYGALIIDPKAGSDIALKVDREQVVLLSEHTRETPERILRNLKGDAGYYNFSKRTTPELIADARKFGLKATLADRAAWGRMRMDPTDIADVGNYTLLVNGEPSARNPSLRFTPGETVRLRFVNGSAMSFMDVRLPGLTMTIVAADGRAVQPVEVDEFRIGVAETYDVVVRPKDQAYPLWVETLDRKASVLASFAPRAGMAVTAPAPRPRQVLLMSEMGHAMGGMKMAGAAPMAGHDMAAMDDATLTRAAARQALPATAAPACTAEHAAMGHCTMTPPAAPAPACTPEHAAMGHCTAAPPPPAAPACTPEHAAMGHCTPAAQSQPRSGTAVAAKVAGGTPFPRVDYGYGNDPMAGHDMGMPALAREGDTDGSGRVFGWASGAPYGSRVLSMRDLVALRPQADTRAPTREIVVKVSGNMERYIWTLNGAKFGEAPPIRVAFNERVRVTFVNETMMAHPMHLHGMFFQVENGQPIDRMPDKNVIAVAPGRTQSVLLTADEAGEWPIHCHLLYHMESGMMQKLVVASVDNRDGTPAAAHAGHGSH